MDFTGLIQSTIDFISVHPQLALGALIVWPL